MDLFKDTEEEKRPIENIEKTLVLLGSRYPQLFSDTERDQYIQGMDYASFKELIVSISASLRGEPQDVGFDGHNIVLQGGFEDFDTPHDDDKDELFADIVANFKRTDVSPSNKAVIAALGINLIHAFKNANGRTSRLIYLLFSGETDPAILRKVCGDDGRKIIDVSPLGLKDATILNLPGKDAFMHLGAPEIKSWGDVYDVPFMDDVSESSKEFITLMLQASHQNLAPIAISNYLLGRSARDESFPLERYLGTETVTREHIYDEATDSYISPAQAMPVINIGTLLSELNDSELQALLSEYRTTKKEYVRTMIDIAMQPDKYPGSHYNPFEDYSTIQNYLALRLGEASTREVLVQPNATEK